MTPDASRPIHILIVDDHPVVRAGLTSMLSTYPELHVVGSATDGDHAIAMLAEHHVDIMLLDLRMPKKNGIETLAALKQLQTDARIIVLTSYESDEDIYQSVRAGAHGYLLKGSSAEEVIEAIHTVHAGERYLPSDIASRLAERMPRANLNSRQTKILEMIANGMTDDQVAAKLQIPNRAVWNQLNTIIEIVGASDVDGSTGRTPAGKITIAEVARAAGVSMSTVSRVLHNQGKHTEETRRAVMKVVKEYDFRLNSTAASLAMMRSTSSQD